MERVFKPSIDGVGPGRRKAFGMSEASVVKTTLLDGGGSLPLVVEPAMDELNAAEWAAANRDFIEAKLGKHCGILFRGFKVKTAAEFERFIEAASGELLEYSYGSTPRSLVSGHIYTSTEYPADQFIPLHNEMSYSREWPMRIFFLCMKPAEDGGETPIADSRKVFRLIDPKIRERFIEKGLMYVRNYGDRLDLPWRQVFQTGSKSEVEDYCRRSGIEFEWKTDERLRTRQVCQAAASHPQTGEMVWFNQAHLFHLSALAPAMREAILSEFEECDLPRNVYHGDGSPIDESMLDEVRDAYRQESVLFPWREGDVLLLDNMLAAHGRTPFRGPRKILVGMSQPVLNDHI